MSDLLALAEAKRARRLARNVHLADCGRRGSSS